MTCRFSRISFNAEKPHFVRIENPRVRGSIPRLATSKIKHLGQSSGVGLFAFGGHCSPIAPAAFNADA